MTKLDALKKATRYIYSKTKEEFGDFGGCGDVVKILVRVAKLLGMTGVKLEFGYMDLSGKEDERELGHAWLRVDGELFDPSAWYHKFTPILYDKFDPKQPDRYQSDLLECLIGIDNKEQRRLAEEASEYVARSLR